MEITYHEIIGSILKALRKHGLYSVWKYYGYTTPNEKTIWVEVEFVNSNYITLAKNRDLIDEEIYLNIGIHSNNLKELSDAYKTIRSMMFYEEFDLIDSHGTNFGKFSFSQFLGATNITYGTDHEDKTNRHRLYVDCSVRVSHTKGN